MPVQAAQWPVAESSQSGRRLEEVPVAGQLLAALDRSLTRRAQSNAASAVRADARHAAARREAAQALRSAPLQRQDAR